VGYGDGLFGLRDILEYASLPNRGANEYYIAYARGDGDSIELVFSVSTHPLVPITVHMGITRSFRYLLEERPLHRDGLSLQLHAYAGRYFAQRRGKLYMTTRPVPKMLEILEKAGWPMYTGKSLGLVDRDAYNAFMRANGDDQKKGEAWIREQEQAIWDSGRVDNPVRPLPDGTVRIYDKARQHVLFDSATTGLTAPDLPWFFRGNVAADLPFNELFGGMKFIAIDLQEAFGLGVV